VAKKDLKITVNYSLIMKPKTAKKSEGFHLALALSNNFNN